MPSNEELKKLVGENRFRAWNDLCAVINDIYDMERSWNRGGKAWTWEYKYRRSGKTLCVLYAREYCAGFMVIFGRAERERFEADRTSYSPAVQKVYAEAATYHDGKWLMFEFEDASLFVDFRKLLAIKRKPNKK